MIRFCRSRFQPFRPRKSQVPSTAARLTSNGGVLVLAMAERQLGLTTIFRNDSALFVLKPEKNRSGFRLSGAG